MTETSEVIKIRIDSLQHTRELTTALAGGLSGAYTVIGVFSANQGLFFGTSGQMSWFSPAWNLCVLGLLLTFVLTVLCFVLSIFLLTDSIHNYSKILEYRQSDLFADAEGEAGLAHQRALVSDDLSYFYVRVGALFLVFNLLLAMFTVTTRPIMQSLPLYAVLVGVVTCGLVAFFLVLHSYRVSHYKVPEHSLIRAIGRFWNPTRWRNAARSFASSKTLQHTASSQKRKK